MRKAGKGGFLWLCLALLVCVANQGVSGPQRSCCHLPPQAQALERPKANKGHQRCLGGHRAAPVEAASASERAAVITQSFARLLQPCPGTREVPAARPPRGSHVARLAPVGLPPSCCNPCYHHGCKDKTTYLRLLYLYLTFPSPFSNTTIAAMGQVGLRHGDHPEKRGSSHAPTLLPCYTLLFLTPIGRTGLGRAPCFPSVSHQPLCCCFNP